MPKWQQYSHKSPVIIVILVGASIWWGFHSAPVRQPHGPINWAIAWLIVLAFTFLASGFWFWRTLIKEFTYDGRTFTFSSLAGSESLPE
jgi:hypothetical protein